MNGIINEVATLLAIVFVVVVWFLFALIFLFVLSEQQRSTEFRTKTQNGNKERKLGNSPHVANQKERRWIANVRALHP